MSEFSSLNENAQFTMFGAREILEISSGAIHIERTITALERSVVEDPGLAFDLSKALIETTCKTIFLDRGLPEPESQKLPPLVKKTVKELNLVPDSYNDKSEVKKSLQTIVNGLSTAIQGLCELRNLEGFASHGRDGYTKSLEPLQALFAARAADTIVNFLYKAHKNKMTTSLIKRVVYGDYSKFDDYLDSSYETLIAGFPYKTSEALFKIDNTAYLDLYRDYENQNNEREDEEE